MGKIIELSHDDVQNELAYALICETMEGAYWNSGRRRRMPFPTSSFRCKAPLASLWTTSYRTALVL